jgi:hypothetical protein
VIDPKRQGARLVRRIAHLRMLSAILVMRGSPSRWTS